MSLGRRVNHFIAAIAHMEGVVLCEQYEDKINGDMFSDIIKVLFQETFHQDGCPAQIRKKAKEASDTVGAIKFNTPPVSTNIKHTENICNDVKSIVRTFEKNVYYEIFEQCSIKVKHALESTPTKYIDETIESLPKRKFMVTKSKGQRIKS